VACPVATSAAGFESRPAELTAAKIATAVARVDLMEFLQAVGLALIQGATEFLPISSSGHLILVPALVG
jgi:hypothetical protein